MLMNFVITAVIVQKMKLLLICLLWLKGFSLLFLKDEDLA